MYIAREREYIYIYIHIYSDICITTSSKRYVRIRQHTSAYVSICIRPLPIYASCLTLCGLHYLSEEVRQHTSAYVSLRIRPLPMYASCLTPCGLHYLFEEVRQNTSAYVSIRQHMHTSAYAYGLCLYTRLV